MKQMQCAWSLLLTEEEERVHGDTKGTLNTTVAFILLKTSELEYLMVSQ
jgi:hypothetical protein